MQENIKRVQIWTGWLRLSHWLIACGVIFQTMSAWAVRQPAADHAFWHDWHIMVGQILIIALLLRLIMLFFPGSGNWSSFLPSKTDFAGIRQMIRFYVSFARYPLPNWYAHNPFWKPVYLLSFIILAICLISGVFYDGTVLLAGLTVTSIHNTTAAVVIAFSALHIVAVFLHDLKGRGALISAMISGSRYFHIDPVAQDQLPTHRQKAQAFIPVDQIKKTTGDNSALDNDDSA